MKSPDPWSRPTAQDLRAVLESIEKAEGNNLREHERIDLAVPAEIVTRRGNTVEAMTREISRLGIGLLHRGSISPGEVTVKMASESRVYLPRCTGLVCTHGKRDVSERWPISREIGRIHDVAPAAAESTQFASARFLARRGFCLLPGLDLLLIRVTILAFAPSLRRWV